MTRFEVNRRRMLQLTGAGTSGLWMVPGHVAATFDNLSVDLDIPTEPVAGQEIGISAEFQVPENPGIRSVEGDLDIRLYVNGQQVSSNTVTVEDGETTSIEFGHVFEETEETTVTVEGAVTLLDAELSVDASRTVNVRMPEPDEELGVSLSVPSEPMAGENVSIDPVFSVPELHGDLQSTLTVRLFVDDREVNSRSVTVRDAETATPSFTRIFEENGERRVRVEGSVTLGDFEFTSDVTGTVNVQVPEPDGDLTVSLTVPDEISVDEAVTFDPTFSVPKSPDSNSVEIEAVLRIDGEKVASLQQVAADQSHEAEFSHTFVDSGEKRIEVVVTATIAGQQFEDRVTDHTNVISRIDFEGAAFVPPEVLQGEIDKYRELAEQTLGNAFVVATADNLYVVFSDREPVEGFASVQGVTLDASIEREGLTFGVVSARDVNFDQVGTVKQLEEVSATPAEYAFELIRVTAHHHSVAIRTRTDSETSTESSLSYPTTTGILVGQDQSPAAMFDDSGARAREVVHEPSAENIEGIVGDYQGPHLFTTSFNDSFWVAAESTIDGIIFPPGTQGREFLTTFDSEGISHVDDSQAVLSVVSRSYDGRPLSNISSITQQSNELDGEVVTVESRLHQFTVSVKEVLEATIGCGAPNSILVGNACVPLVHDVVLHGGAAWTGIPEDRHDILPIMGISSLDQDSLSSPRTGRYRLTGQVVSTSRIDESLPDGSVLLVYDHEYVDDIDLAEVLGESRSLVTEQAAEFVDTLKAQAAVEGDDLEEADGQEDENEGGQEDDAEDEDDGGRKDENDNDGGQEDDAEDENENGNEGGQEDADENESGQEDANENEDGQEDENGDEENRDDATNEASEDGDSTGDEVPGPGILGTVTSLVGGGYLATRALADEDDE